MIDYSKPMLVFQTDFTYAEGAVASMYGVVKSVDRTLEIIDATHQIPQYDTYSASYRLMQYMRFWPKGTIFVSVVDPGVGTSRKACVAKTKDGYYVVTPDNGALTHIALTSGIKEVREIDESINRLKGKDNDHVAIFGGRDVFGYTAARLASGVITYEQVGPSYPVEDIQMFDLPEPVVEGNTVTGFMEIDDPNFGNLWTNIHMDYFEKLDIHHGDTIHACISKNGEVLFDEDITYYKSFGDSEKGKALLYNNEVNKISFAMNQNSFKNNYHVDHGADYKVVFSK